MANLKKLRFFFAYFLFGFFKIMTPEGGLSMFFLLQGNEGHFLLKIMTIQ